MKHLSPRYIAIGIIILIAALALITAGGCRKKSTPTASTTSVPTITPAIMPQTAKDVQWIHISVGYAPIKFASDGTYYEFTSNQGTWVFASPDSIKIQKPFYKVNYKIISATADTLKLMDAAYFVNIYHK